MLNGLRPQESANPVNLRSIEQYRSLCLLALGRGTEAEAAIAAVVASDPMYQPTETEASPRVAPRSRKSASGSCPTSRARATRPRRHRSIARISRPPKRSSASCCASSTTRTWADALATCGCSSPASSISRARVGGAAGRAEEGRARALARGGAGAGRPDPQRVFTAEDEGVTPAAPVRQDVPRVPVQIASQTRERGILDIDDRRAGPRDFSDASRAAAPDLRLAAARRDARLALSPGDLQRQPVKFRKIIQITVTNSHRRQRLRAPDGRDAPANIADRPFLRFDTLPTHGPEGSPCPVGSHRCGPLAAPDARRRYRLRRPVRPDLVLPVETRIVEAIVPRQATLETLLAAAQLPAPLVHAAIESARAVFNPRQLRAERPYRLVLLDRRLPQGVRVPDRRRQFPAHRESRIVDAGQARSGSSAVRQGTCEIVAVRGQIDGEHPSLIAAIDATGETIQLAIALAEHLQRSGRLRERPAARRLVRGAVRDVDVRGRSSRATARSSARGSSTSGREHQRVPLGESRHARRPATTTRTAGR